MYELFVGEIGWTEERFLQLDKHWKIKVVIRGYRRRSRESWMQTRLLMWLVSRVAGGKAESPEELLPLPFDRKTSKPSPAPEDDEQLQKLIAECQEYNRQQEEKNKSINNQKDGNNR